MYPVLSVMFMLKVSVCFVDSGFVIPLSWTLKVCDGLIPKTPFCRVIVACTAFPFKFVQFTLCIRFVSADEH